LLIMTLASWTPAARSQTPSSPQPFVEEQRQQERERALREHNERGADALRPAAGAPASARLGEETPCFRIERIVLEGQASERFQWVLASLADAGDGGAPDDPLNRCLGAQGIQTLLARAQNALVGAGWVTTRVLAGPQDLSGGELRLTLIPGRIAALRSPDGGEPPPAVRLALPGAPDGLLNLRDIEQALENLKRLPSAEADIQIVPGEGPGAQPGDSELVIQYRQAFPLRLNLGLDDSGTRATGRLQSNATVAWDGPLGLNDLFYLSANHSFDNHTPRRAFGNDKRGTGGRTLHYSIPAGRWLLSATYSQSRYHQSVAGLNQDYLYAGESSNGELRITRLLHRDQSSKTSASLRAWNRTGRNFIDDTEIQVQRRATGGWEAALSHRQLLAVPAGRATLDANLAWRQGTGAFGAIAAPEEPFGEGTSRMKLITADASLNLPFALGAQQWRYAAQWRAQWNRTPLTPQDRFAIGGRYSVRGFDGESSLMAERGWLLRNDLGWSIPGGQGAELYAGVDHGQVGGASVPFLLGRRLTGGVIGLRGLFKQLSYDLFVGKPLAKPEGYRTARWTAGFSLNLGF
jgi:hemolysin activation/secretion protein